MALNRTNQGRSNIKKKRKQGFLARAKAVLKRRRRKGRKNVTVA